MKYYKNTNNELFIDPIVKNHIGLIELTKEEFDAQLELNNTPTAEEINDIRIQEIESKCNQVIEAAYPIYKQINITNLLTPYTEDDKDVMKAFIDSKRAICHKAIADGTKAEDVDFSNES